MVSQSWVQSLMREKAKSWSAHFTKLHCAIAMEEESKKNYNYGFSVMPKIKTGRGEATMWIFCKHRLNVISRLNWSPEMRKQREQAAQVFMVINWFAPRDIYVWLLI